MLFLIEPRLDRPRGVQVLLAAVASLPAVYDPGERFGRATMAVIS